MHTGRRFSMLMISVCGSGAQSGQIQSNSTSKFEDSNGIHFF